MAALHPVLRPRQRGFVSSGTRPLGMGAGAAPMTFASSGRVRLVAHWQPDPAGRLHCGWRAEASSATRVPPH